MRKLVSSRAALDADRAAEEAFGYPAVLLMEEAGIRLQDRLEALEAAGAWAPGLVVYLVGPGNNGGDTWVMARQAFLRGRRNLAVVPLLPPSSPSCVFQAGVAARAGLPILPWPSAEAESALGAATVWVDGSWGGGLRTGLRPVAADLVRSLDALARLTLKPVVAVDVPGGLWEGWVPGDPVLTARWTLAAGPAKDFCFFPGLRDAVGVPVEIPLAFPQPAEAWADLLEASDLPDLLPPVASGAHKGRRGHVAVVGGAPGMTGAVVLASRSAAAAGAGLVSLGVDEGLADLVAPQVPAFQVRTPEGALAQASRYGAWVVGPGWGRGEDRLVLLKALWKTNLPLVIDADGLGAWATLGLPAREAPVVLTPHPGEFVRLGAGTSATVGAAADLARNRGVTVVLKGAVTWVLGPDGRRSVWDGTNPALGTGGSGDCLAGVVGALLARGLGGYEAARGAVALHGVAGRELADREGWFTADRLPEALARVSHSACRTDRPRL